MEDMKCKDLEGTMLIGVVQIKEFPERMEYLIQF